MRWIPSIVLGTLGSVGVTLLAQTTAVAPLAIVVDTDHPGADIAPTMYGIFFEDINFGADGGLYAEKIKNRSFEFADAMMGWKRAWVDGTRRRRRRPTDTGPDPPIPTTCASGRRWPLRRRQRRLSRRRRAQGRALHGVAPGTTPRPRPRLRWWWDSRTPEPAEGRPR